MANIPKTFSAKTIKAAERHCVPGKITLLKKVRLEIAVNDEFVEPTVDAITTVAKKDRDKGRGKIFVVPIEECIRIRTGETGKEAIG